MASSALESHTLDSMKSSTTTSSFSCLHDCEENISLNCVTDPKKSGPLSLNTAAGLPYAALGSTSLEEVILCADFHAKLSEDTTTPAKTATARLVATVMIVTSATTRESDLGTLDSLLKVDLSKMSITSIHMVPTRAASGILSITALPATTDIARKNAQLSPLSLFLPPALTLIMDCPIMAHPPIPPRNPVATLPMPWAMHSTWVELGPSSVIWSTSCWVSSVSMRPTMATASAVGAMAVRVPKVSGICGRWSEGRDPAMDAMSPTVLVAMPPMLTDAVSANMAARGAGILQSPGTLLVAPGQILMMAMVSAVRPAMTYSWEPLIQACPPAAVATLNCSSWLTPITMARPFTKPIITGCGTRRMNFPNRRAPKTNWIRPESTTAAKRYSIPNLAQSGARTTAVAPAAPEMTPCCEPKIAVKKAMVAAAWSPTTGGTPATKVKASDSGIIDSVVVSPARTCDTTPSAMPLRSATRSNCSVSASADAARGTTTKRGSFSWNLEENKVTLVCLAVRLVVFSWEKHFRSL